MSTRNIALTKEVVNEIDFDKQFFKLSIDSKRNTEDNVDSSIEFTFEGDMGYLTAVFAELFKQSPQILLAAEVAISFLQREEE
jgi:hypothetical protein